jgi:hypothetical protein
LDIDRLAPDERRPASLHHRLAWSDIDGDGAQITPVRPLGGVVQDGVVATFDP